MAKVTRIKDYKVNPEDRFFFDNNIWMFLFASIANVSRTKQRAYSKFLADVCSAKATVFISSLVLSEYMNSCLRINHKLWEKTEGRSGTNYKKDYRITTDFATALETVKAEINIIMSLCCKTHDYFDKIEVIDTFHNINTCDFNDAYYVELCKKGNYKLVTDDRDFQSVSDDIEIITI